MDAATGAAPDELLAIARHLVRLRNFRTASDLVSGLDPDELDLVDQCFVGTTLLSAQSGIASDELLAA